MTSPLSTHVLNLITISVNINRQINNLTCCTLCFRCSMSASSTHVRTRAPVRRWEWVMCAHVSQGSQVRHTLCYKYSFCYVYYNTKAIFRAFTTTDTKCLSIVWVSSMEYFVQLENLKQRETKLCESHD